MKRFLYGLGALLFVTVAHAQQSTRGGGGGTGPNDTLFGTNATTGTVTNRGLGMFINTNLTVAGSISAGSGLNGSASITNAAAGDGKVVTITNGIVTVADDAYDATGWNGSAAVPTKNAVRDKIETLSAATPWTSDINGAGFALTNVQRILVGGVSGGGDGTITTTNAITGTNVLAGNQFFFIGPGTNWFKDGIGTLDDAYDATAWNGSIGVPTKNAIRDILQAGTGVVTNYWDLNADNSLTNKLNRGVYLGNFLSVGAAIQASNNVYVSGAVAVAPDTLTDAATIATDASLGNTFRVTLGGNRTLGNPTNPTDGQKVTWCFIQDGTGSRTITLDTKFGLGTDISAITLTTTASKRDFMTAEYNLAADKWFIIGFLRGY